MAAQNHSSILFMLITITTALIPTNFACPHDQKQALLEFQSLLPGNSSDFLPWDSSTDCCGWGEVACELNPPVVTGLDLDSFISDPVSSSVLSPLFRLTTLKKLDLSLNLIHGEISGPGFANLTQLVSLDLSQNYFTGSIPPLLFSLTRLESLRINIVDDVEVTVNFHGGPFQRRKGYTLQGQIPAEIGNLTNLKELLLDGNRLSGSIPETLSRLNKLEDLDLHGNFLSGDVPADIGNCSNLDGFQVWDNSLTGTIPSSILNLTKIRSLRFDGNRLSGGIPVGLFDLPSLSELYLGNNKLVMRQRLSDLSPRSKFMFLSLPSCSISDTIPEWVANQTRLYSLDLSKNQIHGAFPQWLVDAQVQDLDLSDNNLEGYLPVRFFQPAGEGQTTINLSRNNLTGTLPKICKNAFDVLVLSDNNLSGTIPSCISNMTSLDILDLSGNTFSGEVSTLLSQENLCPTVINLSSNRFHGSFDVNCTQYLGFLVLGNNKLSGRLPHGLGKVSSLQLLDLHDNNITGEIPSSISHLSRLQVLSLRGNSLEGSIPRGLSNLTALQILDLSNNKLTGELPDWLGNLTGMTDVPTDLSAQALASGTDNYFAFGQYYVLLNSPSMIEVFWKTLDRGLPNQHLGLYTFLDLSSNRFSGEIPDEVGALASLKALNLSHNGLTGKIPAKLGEMRSLESLDLSHNDLSGNIPETFEKLQQLNNLDLSDNNLTGRIPTGTQMDRMNDPGSYANNGIGLCGAQIRVACDRGGNQDVPAPEQEDEDEEKGGERELGWFSWMTASIGFPAGFVTAVLGAYGFGYFQ